MTPMATKMNIPFLINITYMRAHDNKLRETVVFDLLKKKSFFFVF